MLVAKIKEQKTKFSSDAYRLLINAIIEQFAPYFVPRGIIMYARNTGEKSGYFDKEVLSKLGVSVDIHSKMPDVVLYCPDNNWLLSVESGTSHRPIDGKRHE